MLFAALLQQARACDICGGVNHLNPYMFPHLSKSYVSFAYLRSLYYSTEDGTNSKLTNNTLLLSGQYTVNSKLQLMAFIPYHFNRSEVGVSSGNLQGLGDVTLLANYNVLRLQTAALTHSVSLGAGVKLPTGNYQTENISSPNSEDLKLGSGSLDYLLNGAYRVSAGNVTVSAVGSYKYTTPNNSGYRYGDVLTTGASAVYVINQKNLALTPYVQVMNEKHYRDADHHVLDKETGGHVLYTGGGLDVSTTKLTVGVNYQFAAKQNLVQGALTAKPKFSARISFTL